jgi:DNA replication ATP-dependent helicase Dna2
MTRLIQRLNNAIDIEYDAKNDEIDEMRQLPLNERVAKGNTITDITANFIPLINGSTIIFNTVKISCRENLSKFREGTPVVLSGHGYAFELDVLEDNNETMVLKVGWQQKQVPASLNNLQGWNLDSAKVDIRHVVKKSTDILGYNAAKLDFINGIIEGYILPERIGFKIEKGNQIVASLPLNPTQKAAFIRAYAEENYHLIQGPPGTGKTWLLAHLALQFAKEGKKVLITASTHTAINNALQKTSSISNYPHIIKVGKKNQSEGLNDHGSTAKNIPDLRRGEYNNSSRGIIVGATCYSPQTKKLEFMEWDVIIFDEAGQISIPLAVSAMVKGKKFIFVGDHKQLPPIISEKQNDVTFTKSIFEHLFQFTGGQMLDTTFRMNKEINAFPSKQFYSNKLQPHPDNADNILNISNNFNKHQQVLDISSPEVLFCHHHQAYHSRSEFEAETIAEFVEEYLNNGVDPKEIAVITPFRSQVRQIKKALAGYSFYSRIKEDLFVDTVERIQGQEKDIIIFSLAVADPEKARLRAEFFFNPNRFNVALTRAKKKRIVIANQGLFNVSSNDDALKPLIANFKEFYNSSHKIVEETEIDLF